MYSDNDLVLISKDDPFVSVGGEVWGMDTNADNSLVLISKD